MQSTSLIFSPRFNGRAPAAAPAPRTMATIPSRNLASTIQCRNRVRFFGDYLKTALRAERASTRLTGECPRGTAG
jgi:hypothetical protein